MVEFVLAENRMFQVDGHDFIFLVKENALFEVDRELQTILAWCRRQPAVAKEELAARIEGSSEEKNRLLEGLVKRHVIVPRSHAVSIGRELSAGPSLDAIPLQTLILQVTDACNLACSYCYYSGTDGFGEKNKGRRWMPPEIAERGIDFLLEHSANRERLVLVFFGGEPLLNFRLIASVVAYARSKAAASNKHIDFALTTNGTLLKEDVVQYLLDQELGVTVSMDGCAQVHDRHRRFPNGAPSYEVILPGLKTLLGATSGRPVVARVTVAEDPGRVPEILDHLLGLGFAEVGFSPVSTGDPSYQLDRWGMDRLLEQFETLSMRFVEAARNDEFLGFSNLIDLLVVLHQSEVRSYPCGAGLGLFSVDPGGRLYLCQRFTGEESFCMGDLGSGFDRARLQDFRERAEIGQKEACPSCWARAACAGGCYYEAWVREKSPFKANIHYCDWIRRWVDLGLHVYGRIYLANPDYLDKLSVLRGQASIFNQLHIDHRRFK